MDDTVSLDATREKNVIEVMDAGVYVRQLLIPRSDVANYLRAVPEEDRVIAFIHAVEVGVFCLERSRGGADMDFVRRQIDGLLDHIERAVSAVPGAVETSLVEKIGTADGQVLAPVQAFVEGVSKATDGRVQEIRKLFADAIDPSKETSTLGAALKALRDLLDPGRRDSIQGSFESALETVAAPDGSLANVIKGVVSDAVTPLKNEIDDLGKEFRRREVVASVIDRTTEKGTLFEDEVVARLQPWAKVAGAQVSHVGPDKRPGDIVVALSSDHGDIADIRLVIEARDRESQPAGRTPITDSMTRAMAERNASLGIFLSRRLDGLAKEIGEWAEGTCEHGRWVATTEEHLTSAMRFLLVQQRLETARNLKPEIDVQVIDGHIGRIRDALVKVKNIKTSVTDGRKALDSITSQADALQKAVRDALDEIEEALQSHGQ
jgi:hypothetical protein